MPKPEALSTRQTDSILLVAVAVSLLLVGCPGEDINPPAVEVVEPAAGATVSGTVTIKARATDDRGVSVVEFYADSTKLGSDSTSDQDFYSLSWNTAGLAPGSAHVLYCVARDHAGNHTMSATVPVVMSASAGTHHGGPIVRAETWRRQDNPHVVDRDLAVEAVLTLEPGVRVFVADNAAVVAGSRNPSGLVCRGKADTVISFTALSSPGRPGSWKGIELDANCLPESTVFEHCVVEYAGGNGKALLYSSGAAPAVRSSSFRSSTSAGVAAASGGFSAFEGNVMSGCAGFALSVDAGSAGSIGYNNRFDGNGLRGIELTAGTVAATDTWQNPGVPYCITGTATVADSSNPLLSVAAGCSLLFADSCRLRVGVGRPGGLQCDGSYGRITFAGLSSAPVPGAWRGIEFLENTDQVRSVLRYCVIENAGAAASSAIWCYSAAITIAGCRISNSASGGIQCTNTGFARFESDTVTGCNGFPLRIAAPYVATLGTGNLFAGNAKDVIDVAAGPVTRNAQWRNQGVPYVVNGMVEVGSTYEPTLTVGPGTVLQFAPGSGLAVGRSQRATLLAIGVPDSITFTGTDSVPGWWCGVELHTLAQNSSILDHCRLLYGGGGNTGILLVDSCVPTVTGCEIAYSSNYCCYLINTDLDPDMLLDYNWLHDWAEGYEPIGP
jgi:hypothetical protein